MRALSRREARLLAVALLLAVLALADLAIIEPVRDGFAARTQQRALLLARYAANDRLIGAIPRLGREAARRGRLLGDYTLAAPDAGAAADALRSRIETATAAVGGDFHGAEDLPGPVAGPGTGTGANTVAMRAALRVSAGQLTRLLAMLENAPPYLTITALAIHADDSPVTGQAATLDVTLDTAILYRPAPAR